MKYITSILIFISITSAIGQNSVIESLSKRLDTTKSNSLKSKICVKLAVEYLRIDDNANFSKYTFLADSIAKDVDNPRVKGAVYKLLSIYERDKKNYDASYNFSEKAIEQFIIAKDSVQVGKSVNSAIKSLIKERKLAESEQLYLKYQDWINPLWSYKISMDLSRHYVIVDDFEKTLYYLKNCHSIAHSLNNNQLIGKSYYRIAGLYRDLDNLEEAFKNIQLALKYLKPEKNLQLYGATYLTLASIYEEQKKGEKALKALDSSYYYYRDEKSKQSKASVLSKKANILFHLEKFSEARSTIDEAIQLDIELNYQHGLAYDYSRLSKILFFGEQKSDSAIYYSKKALVTAKEKNLKLLIKSLQYNLSTFLSQTGNYEEAFGYLKDAYKYNDSLYKVDVSEKMKEIQEKFQNEKKEKELALERVTNKELALKNAKLNNLIYVIVFCAVIIGIFLFFYLRGKKQQIENERQKSSLEINRLEKEVKNFEDEWALRNKKDESFIISIQDKFYEHLALYFDISKTLVNFWVLQASSGLSERDIAKTTGIPYGTIDGQRKSLYHKLQLKMNKKYNRNTSVALYLSEYKKFIKREFLIYQARKSP